MKKSFRALLLAPALGLAACTFSGLPADQQLQDLSEEEATLLCEATQRYNEQNLTEEERKTFGCNVAAVVGGSLAAGTGGDYTEACEEAQSTCMEDEDTGPEETSCDDVTVIDGCEATVEQYEACVQEQIAEIKKSNAEFTCAEPPEEEEEDDGEQTACEIYVEACGGDPA